MNLNTLSTTAKTTEIPLEIQVWQRASQYTIYGVTGFIGGASGVALSIGLALIAQIFVFPEKVFVPNAVLMALVAALLGVGVSWLLSGILGRIWPRTDHEQAVQMMFVSTVFFSLLVSLLFMYGL